MRRERDLVKNTLILSLGTFLPKLTTIITLPILTGFLTKAEYGVYDLINTLVSLIIPLVTMKLEMATFRFLIDHRNQKKESARIITTSFCAVMPVSLVTVTVLYFCLKYYSYSPITCLLISIYFLIDNIYTMLLQSARGLGYNLYYSISAIINSVISMLLIVALVWKIQMGLEGLLIAINVAILIAIACLVILLRFFSYLSISLFSWNQLKEMFSYSLPLVPNALSSWVMSLSDRLIVTAMLGIEANAVYAIANKIPSLFNTFQGTFISAWHENASISVGDKDSDDYYSNMFDLIFDLLIGTMAGLIAVTPILFKFLINEKYTEAYYQMPFLFGGMICFSLSSFMGGIYAAHKKTKSVGLTTIAAAISNLLINFAFVRLIGLYAASISTFISFLVLIIYRMIDVKKFQPMKYNLKKILIYTIVICLMCFLSFINSIQTNSINFIFGIVFAVVINRKVIATILRGISAKMKGIGK